MTCAIEGCDRPVLARGWCVLHYSRWQGHGDAEYEPPTLAERFWAKVAKSDGCWEWTAARTPMWGYGHIRVGGHTGSIQGAHRVSWTLANGPIPPGMEVCHRCDNPPCVRPDHLFLGTGQANSDDKMAKGRDRKALGAANGRAKLTADQVAEIRRRVAAGETQTSVARDFGVNSAHVSRLVRGLRR